MVDFSTIAIDAETIAFWHEVRAFVASEVTEDTLDEERRTGSGFNEALHLALGERGWVLPRWPTEKGGAGLDATKSHILETELRRSGAPHILRATTILTIPAIETFASPELRDKVLPSIASGHVRICLGYTEPDVGSDLAGVRTRAVRDGDHWILVGQKMFTTAAHHSQYCLLLARTEPDAPKHLGLTVFLVPLHLDGISITPVATLGGERTNFVYYDDVRLPDAYRVGAVNEGWKVIQAALDAEHGVRGDDLGLGDSFTPTYHEYTETAFGATVAALRATAPERLADPTVLERLATVAIDIERSRVSAPPYNRVLSAETLIKASADLLDLAGVAGVVRRGELGGFASGILEETYRFAQGTSIYGGTTEVFRNMIAERILGLPRSRT